MSEEVVPANRAADAFPAAGQRQVRVVVQPPEQGRATSGHPPGRRFSQVRQVPTAAIHPTPLQLRKRLSPGELQALAVSIRDKGMAQPVLLRRRPGSADAFELIAGYRRWRAASLAGIAEIPALIIERLGDKEALELAIIENLQRQDLTILEEAEAIRNLVEEHGQTHEQIAAATGRSHSQVSNILRLLGLPSEVKAMIEAGHITFGHARALLAAESPAKLAARIAAERLAARETERPVGIADGPSPSAAARSGPVRPEPPGTTSPQESTTAHGDLRALQAEIAQELGSTVEITVDGGAPTISIRTRSPQEAVTAARTIRDALHHLNMSRAMRQLAGSGGTG